MTRDEFVDELIGQAKQSWDSYWRLLPDEQRLRLAGMEEELRSIVRGVEEGLWALLAERLDELAVALEGQCGCGRCRERRMDSIEIDILGHRCEFPCTYLYCRHCHVGVSPVRRWLGVEQGGVSLGFERALTDLTTRMTFGDAVISMREHHDQDVDRTKAQRVTYQVGLEAQEYLQERRNQAREKLRSGEHEGVEQLEFTADGGAVPIGKLTRPPRAKVRANTPKTEVRKLAKGTRTISGREARFISVHDAQPNSERVIDCHIAPYENTRYTGERMFAAAAEAGLGDKSSIHGVFDMGKWIHTQFEEQFCAYERSACADIMHVAEYLIDAGRCIVGADEAVGWGMERKRRMLAGGFEDVLADLQGHVCQPGCAKNEHGACLARVAQRYLENNSHYMKDYEELMEQGLPVGSGEAESGIRHIIKRRMSVAGAWEENNAPLMLALLAIRASGWWDVFWQWRAERDRQAWRDRQEGKVKVLFRAKRRKDREKEQAA
jgi:hypothetical protein